MGALVASAIGLVVITGITKLFVQMGAQLKQAEQKVQRINLNSLLGNYMNDPGHCKETLLPSAPQISTGNDSSLKQIKIKGGGTALDLVLEKNQLKTKYGMEGFTDIQLKCEETGGANACKKCSGPFPCPSVKWSLSLVSQTYVNQVPSFNRLLEKALVLTHTGPNDSDFECFLTAPPSTANCEDLKGTIEGYDSHGNKKCYYLCPKGKTRKDGFGCDCPTGYLWTGTQCAESCSFANPSWGTFYGVKLDSKCFNFMSFSLGTNAMFIPGLGIFISSAYNSHFSGSIFNRQKYALELGNTVQGFDENDNPVSFKPCPSGQVWIGSKCAEYCQETQNLFSGGVSVPYTVPGIKIKNRCYSPCLNTGFGYQCFFIPKLQIWLFYTKEIQDRLPNTIYKQSSETTEYMTNEF